MPRLPTATDLSASIPGPARSFTSIPVPDIAGAASAVARGVGQVGESVYNVQEDRQKKAAAQERFNTKMGLLKAEEAYADRVKDLDPLDPDYVEKKKAARRETFGPVLSSVQDPDNKMDFDLATQEDYVNLGIKAEAEQREAFGKKSAVEIGTYAGSLRRKIRSGSYTGDAREDLRQTIEDNQYLTRLEKDELFKELGTSLDIDTIDAEFDKVTTTGVSVTPEVNAAITAVQGVPGVAPWMGGYLGRLATVESGGGRKMINPDNPDVAGVWQFASATGKDFGLNSREDRLDIAKSTEAVVKLTMRNHATLKEALGREPTKGELYLAHQQGAAGAIKLLTDPDAKATSVVGRNAVKQNLPESLRDKTDGITAGQFSQLWTGKFDGNSGQIDDREVMGVLENSPAWARLPSDQQDKAKASILTRIDKQNKEVEKTAKIELQRAVVDTAVAGFEDRAEAEKYVKKTITDPEAREEALKMLTAQYNRIDEAEKVRYKTGLDGVWANVNAALDRGDIDGAKRAIPAEGLDRKDLDDLNKAVNDDGIKDDPKVLDGLTALKIGTEQERRYFANVDGQGLNVSALRGVLSRDKLEALAKEQEAFRKQYETTAGKLPTYDTAGQMLALKAKGLGIKTGADASEADIRYYEILRSIMAQNTEAAVTRLGRDLTPSEMEGVLDQTFMQFREKGRPGFQISAWGAPLFQVGGGGDTTFTAKDVIDEFSTIEADHGAAPGEYITRAQKALKAKGQDVTPAKLRAWLQAGINAGVLKKNSEAQ